MTSAPLIFAKFFVTQVKLALCLIVVCSAVLAHAASISEPSPFQGRHLSQGCADCQLSECQECIEGQCVNKPLWTSCADGDRRCNGQGSCVGGCLRESTCGQEDCNKCLDLAGSDQCYIMPDGSPCSLEGGGQGTCLEDGGQSACTVSVVNDPIIGGFNGKKFHFDEVGDFTLIKEGAGWQVDTTFSAPPPVEGAPARESSWTTGVRVHSPQGDMVSCSLPAVHPNTSLVQVVAVPSSSPLVLLTPQHLETTLGPMTASATLSWKEYAGVQYSSVVGCRVRTPLMEINVYQVSGWEEAQAKPEQHGWAAPYTWLNIGFTLHKRLTAPVTGIMGDTYPQETASLAAVTNASRQQPGSTPEAYINPQHGGHLFSSGVGEEDGTGIRTMLAGKAPFTSSFSVVGL